MNLKEKENKYNIAVVNFIFAQGKMDRNRYRNEEETHSWSNGRDHGTFTSSYLAASYDEIEEFFKELGDDPYGNIDWDKLETKEDTHYYSNGTFDDSDNPGWNFTVDIWSTSGKRFLFSYEMDSEDFGDLVNDLILYPATPESIAVSYDLLKRRSEESNYTQGGSKENYYKFFIFERKGWPKLKCWRDHWGPKAHTQRQLDKEEVRKLPHETMARYMALLKED